jgi:hypothetical protein
MTREDARELFDSTVGITGLNLRQHRCLQKQGVHKALGYSSYGELMDAEGIPHVKLSLDERKAAAREMILDGAGTKEVADVVGVDQRTIQRDLATNVAKNGKRKADSTTNVVSEEEGKRADLQRRMDINMRFIGEMMLFLQPRSLSVNERAEEIIELLIPRLNSETLISMIGGKLTPDALRECIEVLKKIRDKLCTMK